MKNLKFPNNLLGTNLEFNEISPIVFICGEYHGRYEDDDFVALFYDSEKKTFYNDCWTTAAYMPDENIYTKVYQDINYVSAELAEEVFAAAMRTALDNIHRILEQVQFYLEIWYNKRYNIKKRDIVFESIKNNLPELISQIENLPEIISLFHCERGFGYDTREFFWRVLDRWVLSTGIEIKRKLTRAVKVKLSGNDYTGKVVSVKEIKGRFGVATKIGIKPENTDKSVWGLINTKSTPKIGETITINGVVKYETERSISLSSVKRIDHLEEKLIERITK